ncbi:ankyrin repeat domain-containing protein 27 isoform X2 [Festucalex cinctus]
MALYDEDVARNPFFAALEKLRPDLCERVAQMRGIVLVPCCGSLEGSRLSQVHFDSYVLHPVDDGYQTADGKEVRIQDRQVLLGSGFPPPVSVAILFEETFYNSREESFSILCVGGPVDGGEPATASSTATAPSSAPSSYHLRNLEEVEQFLGRHRHKLDKLVANFCQAFKRHERKGLRQHIDSVHGLYTRCLQCVLRDAHLVPAKQELQMTLLKEAVEVYVHHGIHSLIFNLVGTLEASQDAAFNKMTRSLHELQHKDVGVKAHFSVNLPRAKRELSQLNRQTSPLLKLLCLRRVALSATRAAPSAVIMEAVCADDLLSVILYLLVNVEIPNWMANLSYMRNFSFSQSSQDELSYCLSTFEAAAEYIKLGKLRHALAGRVDADDKPPMKAELASASTPIGRLLEHVANGDEAEVARLLSQGENQEDAAPCHPLCSCDLCDLRLAGKLNEPSAVTASSRDERGYTPLHVAAVCGQAQLIDLLASKGAPVNASDDHTLTPLHLACRKGYQGVTLLLLHYKADADARDNNGNTPLHLACMYGHDDCVKALVYYDSQTCRLDAANEKGDTPLHVASRWGYQAIVGVLLENGASAGALNKDARTPAHCALNSKVLTLLRKDEEQRCGNGGGGGARSPARVSPQMSGRRSSTSSGASSSPGRERPPERAPVQRRQVEKLLRAVADADVQMVRYLLEWTDEDEADASDETSLCHPLCQCATCAPAHKARAAPFGGVGGALCVTSANADGVTPLHVSCMCGHAELTSLLLRHGADADARTHRKATPLHLASQNNHLQVVKLLLECNAKLNKKDRYGNTALIHACLHGNLDAAAALVQSEALVNVGNRQGNTALHCAVRAAHLPLVDLLLKAGASPHLRNKKHRTPLDAAHQQGGKNAEIVRSLQKASGLSPDDEPIKLLSVPKGTLAHNFVQRLKLNDAARHKSAAGRIQQMKKTSRSPSARPATPTEQASPDVRRQRLQRGGTVDVGGGPSANAKGRGLARWHTLDSGEDARTWTRRRRSDATHEGPAFAMTSSDGRRDVASAPQRANAKYSPRVQDAPVSGDASDIRDGNLTGDTPLSSAKLNTRQMLHIQDTPHVTCNTKDTSLHCDMSHSNDKTCTQDTPLSSDAPHTQHKLISGDMHDIKDTSFSSAPQAEPPLSRDASHSEDTPHDSSHIAYIQDTTISGHTANIKDTPLSGDAPNSSDIRHIQDTATWDDAAIKDTPLTCDTPLSGDAPNSSDMRHIQDTGISDDAAIKDTPLNCDTHLSGVVPNCGDMCHIQDISRISSDIKDTAQ